jgi:hypothetical protein
LAVVVVVVAAVTILTETQPPEAAHAATTSPGGLANVVAQLVAQEAVVCDDAEFRELSGEDEQTERVG